MPQKKIHITYFFRKPQPQYFSIEKVFEQVISSLPSHIISHVYRLSTGTSGWWGRIQALVEIRKRKGIINHITGDITFVAAALPRKGLVVTYHDLESLAQYKGWRLKLLKYLWVIIPVRRAQVVTAISQHTKQQLIKWTNCSPYKVVVIPNPLPDELNYQPKDFNTERTSILVMGTKVNKNVVGIFEAVHLLMKECTVQGHILSNEAKGDAQKKSKSYMPEEERGAKEVIHQQLSTRHYKLIVVGEMTSEQQALADKYQLEIDNLVQVPYEQILAAYQQCNLLCFPSFYEGFGLPIIEAQAIGRPVITSNFGAMKEVAGEGAILINPRKAEEIKGAIIKLTENQALYETMVKKGLKNVERFKARLVAEQYAKIYENLR